MALLEVQGLTAGYGIVQVLFGLDFSVDAGEAVVILGANGSGKTTTLRAVSGMIAAGGAVRFDGRSVRGMRPDRLVAAGVSHVPQGRGTISDLTVDENLRAGAYSRRDRGIAADIEHWYSVFPRLGERRDQAAGSMSGGEQQMLAIARAFMSRPRLVLLDEPSLGLAPLVTREVFDRVGDLVRDTGTAVLVVEQNANLALAFASRAYVLEAGRIVNQGSSDELRGDESIRQAYLGS
ncbi:MAG: ABC transporter ATP-binding protein [Microthrixaceae bacterium]|jgi:branched-chain amino acid transport system ATP-binding protein|nr:ABC transporter ATP-binding protein [Actinomycetota bacterium]MBP6729916.1 ABC transporter ATP-binding protein [Microthrixaceae bacterium]HMS12681.1 ABC transporter ATP-binding protein [Microthrixaceae bacterium]HMT60394.1 ABC transporter ATP-binding protein [Microthrixaceae bacterium]